MPTSSDLTSDTAIVADGLTKTYRIGASAAYHTLREMLTGLIRLPGRRTRTPEADVHALRKVSFHVRRGEVLGVIGRNGAGKTTLLKVLSRITQPTSGEARIRGRVATLFEVGTGFHPELTGRENILLNGTILGMRRREVREKLDEIVAFSGVEEFIDVPVKRYSSGMYLRLAFSVAAHLEPEILFIDEVLGVGDLAFQRKCLGKMDEVSKQGRTILFVSHQLNQVRRLCQRSIWLDSGAIRADGPTSTVLARYEAAMSEVPAQTDGLASPARFLGWELIGSDGVSDAIEHLGEVMLRLTLQVNRVIRRGNHGICLFNSEQQLMWGADTRDLQFNPGRYHFEYRIASLPLRPGPYHLHASIWEEEELLDSCYFPRTLVIATRPLTHSQDRWTGVLNVPYEMSIVPAAERAEEACSRETSRQST